MNTLNRTLRVLCAAVLIAVIAPSAVAKKLLEGITLDWKPTITVSANAADIGASRGKKIQIGVFTDNRSNKRLIAENREDEKEGTVLPVTTDTDVPAWVGNHIADLLQQMGYTTVTTGGDYVLDGSVEKFFVLETDTYKANVALHLRLANKNGDSLWDTTLNATQSRFGRSYQKDNYCELLSDALVNLTRTIATSADFRSALTQ
ncbi:MAG TPA: hypothetical protein VGK97_10880 [Spongiibacteraceae bacterium]